MNNPQLRREAEHTIFDGQRMKAPLEKLFLRTGFDTSLIAQHGVLCLDVGNGPEIEALRSYNPSNLTVSEPLSWWDGRRPGRGKERRSIIESQSAGTNLHIVDGDPLDAMDYITRQLKRPVGLATMLNSHPTRLNGDWFFIVGVRAGEVLANGGLMVLSVWEEEQSYTSKLLESLAKLHLHGEPSVRYEFFKDEYSKIGSQYLLAQSNVLQSSP